MIKYDIALFDLDGTLSESGEGILECVRSIFAEMERPLPDEAEIRRFIGPPMYDSLKRVGLEDEDAEKGVEIYKKNYLKSGIYKNRVYDGMHGVLTTLKDNGVKLAVASTKYQKFTDRIIAGEVLADHIFAHEHVTYLDDSTEIFPSHFMTYSTLLPFPSAEITSWTSWAVTFDR